MGQHAEYCGFGEVPHLLGVYSDADLIATLVKRRMVFYYDRLCADRALRRSTRLCSQTAVACSSRAAFKIEWHSTNLQCIKCMLIRSCNTILGSWQAIACQTAAEEQLCEPCKAAVCRYHGCFGAADCRIQAAHSIEVLAVTVVLRYSVRAAFECCARAVQELQNSILDQTRQLQEAADDRATLQNVHRQLRAELARAQDEAAAAKEEAAQKGRELASVTTLLKVRRISTARHTTAINVSSSIRSVQ